MNRLVDFVRSDLFLSLAGGFALGIAGLTVIHPASAETSADVARSLTVETPQNAQKIAYKTP